jgi:purine-nucleoside phosphorylase
VEWFVLSNQSLEHIQSAVMFLKKKLDSNKPKIALILGSGLGEFAENVSNAIVIPYSNVPYFPVTTVEGHAGQFVVGELENVQLLIMQGRFHYYEGYAMQKIVMPIYVMKELGIETLIITNAAGGMNRSFQAGDLMVIRDHINLTGDNPLIGENNSKLGPRFPDMSQAYDREWIQLAHQTAKQIEDSTNTPLSLKEGVYVGISGPTYETPAELTMIARIGGDAVGMSTVAEVIAARHAGLRVFGLSSITDMAIGEHLEPLTHEQVIAMANQIKPKLMLLLKKMIQQMNLIHLQNNDGI